MYKTKQMAKVGDKFVPIKYANGSNTAGGKEFSIIMADYMGRHGWGEPAPGVLIATQKPPAGTRIQGGNHLNNHLGWKAYPGTRTWANYAQDDGSVTNYTNLHFYSLEEGTVLNTWNSNGGFLLPEDMAE